MHRQLDIPCPGCPDQTVTLQVSVNDTGSQTFADGTVQRKVTCDACGTAALVTLQGAGNEPHVTRIPTPAKQNQEARRQR